MPHSYRQVLSRVPGHRLLQVRSELGMLDRGELWHPLSGDEYRALLFLELEELEAAVEEIEGEWYG